MCIDQLIAWHLVVWCQMMVYVVFYMIVVIITGNCYEKLLLRMCMSYCFELLTIQDCRRESLYYGTIIGQ